MERDPTGREWRRQHEEITSVFTAHRDKQSSLNEGAIPLWIIGAAPAMCVASFIMASAFSHTPLPKGFFRGALKIGLPVTVLGFGLAASFEIFYARRKRNELREELDAWKAEKQSGTPFERAFMTADIR